MIRSFQKFILIGLLHALCCSPVAVTANPIGDFFSRVGRTISKYRKATPTPTPRPRTRSAHDRGTDEMNRAASASPAPPSPMPTPSPTPLDVRPAMLAPPTTQKRDLPYGVAVPNRPGLVTSPYAPDQGYVDVSAFPSSTEVLDPFTGKIFRTP